MHHILGIDRNQIQMMALEEMVSEDSWARVIDLFVDSLPIKELGFDHASIKKEGRPSVLLKLYMYGYKHAIRSTRKLEHSCKVNIELWWLLKGLRPSFRSIAYFRKNNATAIKSAFRHLVLMLQDLNLIEGETIAVDSFKIRAQNSMKNNYSQKKIDRHIDYIDNKIKEYEQQLEHADNLEHQEIKSKIAEKRKRRKQYKVLEKQLDQSGEKQISTTDPEAKALIIHRNVMEVGYCIQAATDKKNKLFIHADIGGTNDKRELGHMAVTVKNLLNLKTFNTLSDAGYATGDQFDICQSQGITTYCSPMPSTSPRKDCISRSEFTYHKEQDCYICPSGNQMKRVGKGVNRVHYKSFLYKTQQCKTCTIRKQCTNNKKGRVIERSQYQDIIDANQQRVLENPDYYKLRQQIIEHQFGTLKRQWGFTFTLMKEKKNVLSEVNLLMMVYNLHRSISILGKNKIKKILKAYLNTLFKTSNQFRLDLSLYIFKKELLLF